MYFYLQGILATGILTRSFGSLCMEIQFYLVYALLLVLAAVRLEGRFPNQRTATLLSNCRITESVVAIGHWPYFDRKAFSRRYATDFC